MNTPTEKITVQLTLDEQKLLVRALRAQRKSVLRYFDDDPNYGARARAVAEHLAERADEIAALRPNP